MRGGRAFEVMLGALSVTGCALIDAASGGPTKGTDAARPDGASSTVDAKPDVDAGPDAPVPDGGPCAFTGVLASWDFAAESGLQASTNASTTAPGVSAGAISRSAALIATSGTGSINSSNWTTSAALDGTRYYTFSISPPAGCTLQVSSLAIDLRSSATGPTMAAVASSADGFTQTLAVSPTAPSTPALSVSGVSGTLELRIYGFAAASTSGSMRVQNTLSITGAVQ